MRGIFRRLNLKRVNVLVLILLLINQFVPPGLIVPSYAEGDPNPLAISKTQSVDTVKTGEQFYYTISYAVNDLEKHFKNVWITDILPEGMEYVGVDRNNHTKDINYDAGSRTVSVRLASGLDDYGNEVLEAGTSGVLTIHVYITRGNIEDGTPYTNVASISADAIDPTTGTTLGPVGPIETAPVTVTTTGAHCDWSTTKTKVTPAVNPMPGAQVTYRVGLAESSTAGNVGLKGVVLTDQLPTGSKYIPEKSSDDGIYDADAHTVTWNIGDVEIGGSPNKTVTVEYPESEFTYDRVTEPEKQDSATNTVTATGESILEGVVATILPGHSDVTFVGPTPPVPEEIGFNKSCAFQYRSNGQTQTFTISNIRNTGNVSIDNVVVEDLNLPSELIDATIALPNPNMDVLYDFLYETDSGWSAPIHIETAETFNVTELGIKAIKLDFGTVPGGWNAGSIVISGVVSGPISHDTAISNTATMSYEYDLDPMDAEPPVQVDLADDAAFTIWEEKPWIVPSKGHNAGYFIDGDTVTFNLTVANMAGATGSYNNPIIYDLLPAELEYIEGSWTLSGTSIEPQFDKSEFGGRTLLKWWWPNASAEEYSIPVGGSIGISYKANIPKYTPAGNYESELYITTNANPSIGFWWGGGNGHDWDTEKDSIRDDLIGRDFNSTQDEYLVKSTDSVTINKVASVKAIKWNKGCLDSEYSKYPDNGTTVAGGTADYKLVIMNDGNVNLTKIEVLDILPYIGDTAVLTSQDRKSEWRPNLIIVGDLASGSYSKDAITADKTIYYSFSNDKLSANFDFDKTDTNYWLETVDDVDIPRVESVYIVLDNINSGSGLVPGEEVALEWKMRAPVGAPNDIVAWNSFGVRLTDADGLVLQPTEPNKVGFNVEPYPVDDPMQAEIGNYVWFDSNGDGIQNDGWDEQNAGINGIRTRLYAEGGTLVDETRTANDQNGKPGYYLFPHLSAGNYYIEFELLAPGIGYDYGVTSKDTNQVDVDLATDSDVSMDTRKTDIITLSGGEKNYNIDMGLTGTASMSIAKEVVGQKTGESIDTSIKDRFNKNETIVYQIAVQNTGNVPLHNVKIQDVMDRNQNGFQFTKAGFDSSNLINLNGNPNVSAYSNSGSEPYLVVDKIDAGATYYVRGEYTVTTDDVDGTKLTNTVNVWSNETNATVPNAGVGMESQTKTLSVDIADISISKISAEDAVEPGAATDDLKTVNYTITVTNNGSVDLTSVKVIDDKVGFEFDEDSINADANLTLVGSTVTIGTLASGASVDILGKYVSLEADLPNKISNTATAEHVNIRYTLSATDMVDTKDLVLTKVATSSVIGLGQKITYNIMLKNNGSMDLSDVEVTEDMLSSVQYSEPTLYNLLANGNMTGTIPNPLGAGDSATITLEYVVSEDDVAYEVSGEPVTVTVNTVPIVNTAKATSFNTSITEEATATVDIAHVKVEKTETSVGPYKLGDAITYDVVVTNIGTVDLNNIEVRDRVYNKSGGTNYTDVAGYTIAGPLAVGASHSGTLSYTLTDTDLQELNSSPLKDVAIARLQEVNNDVFSNEVTVQTKGIEITKSGAVSSDVNEIDVLDEGDEIEYTFTVRNIGSTELATVTISDPRLDPTPPEDYVIASLAAGEEVAKTYIYTVVAGDLPGPIINTATVTCSDPELSDSDTHYMGDPTITIQKNVVLGHENASEIQTEYDTILASELVTGRLGTEVTYVFTVTNVGDTYLSNIGITDAQLGINEGNLTLIPELSDSDTFSGTTKLKGYDSANPDYDEKLVFYYHATIDGDLENTATVNANPVTDGGADIPGAADVAAADTAKVLALANIGDYVWLDENFDGVQDVSEDGIEGVTISLYEDGNPVPIMSDTTDSNGAYLFEGIVSGDYTVVVDSATLTPDALVATYDRDGDNNSSTVVQLRNGVDGLDVDFGYTHSGKLGDAIWYDLDDNGEVDTAPGSEEVGIVGVRVVLTGDGGFTSRETTTDATGYYEFIHLPAGEFTVTVDATTLPAGVEVVSETTDSTPDNQQTITLAAGETNMNVDFGYNHSGQLGDTVWYDLNENGSKDSGEDGIEGVTVELYRDTDKIKEATTNADGYYQFTELPQSPEGMDYKVTVVSSTLRAGLAQVYDPDGTKDHTATTALAAGGSVQTLDFGYNHTASVGNFVWLDENKDGSQVGESGIGGVTVVLKDASGSEVASIDTANGFYGFDKLAPGTYTVEVDETTLPPGVEATYDIDGSLDGITTFILGAGETKNDVDFGYVGVGIIGDTVWIDENKNGLKDFNEVGLADVRVGLRNGGGRLWETRTDANGIYRFDNLMPDEYTVMVDASTLPGAGGPKPMISTYNIDDVKDHETTIILAPNTSNLGVDFGYRVPRNHMTLEKSADKESAPIGATINYTITLTNDGDYELNNVKLQDDLVNINETIPTLEIDEVITRTGSYRVSQSDWPGSIVNTATATCTNTEDAIDTCEVSVVGNPVLAISKTGPSGPAKIGDEIRYTIVVENKGNVRLSKVQLIDDMLGLNEDLGNIAVGKSVRRVVSYTVTEADVPGPIVNTAVAKSRETKDVQAMWSIPLQVTPKLQIVKRGPLEPAEEGDVINYTIRVTNTGDIALTNVRVVDAKLGVDDMLPILAVKESREFTGTYVVTDDDVKAGKVLNRATASSDQTGTVMDEWHVSVNNPDEELPPVEIESTDNDDGTISYAIPEGAEVEVVEQPSHGSIVIGEDGNIKYVREDGYHGRDSFSVKLIDVNGNEMLFEIDIPEEEVPLGTIEELPKTGEGIPYAYYLSGLAIMLLGVYLGLKRRLNNR